MTQESLKDLLISELKDLYSAENQLTKALPKMVKAANCEQLQKGFEGHLQKTKQHVERLTKVFQLLKKDPAGKKCMAMEGLIKEGGEVIEEYDEDSSILDAGLICAAQKVEHYEIAGYGSVIAWAELLGLTKEAEILKETLEDEKAANSDLTELATGHINKAALTGSDKEDGMEMSDDKDFSSHGNKRVKSHSR